LPLGLDTFAISAALGLRGLPPGERLRISLLLSLFEAAMPLVGLLLGRVTGGAVGSAGDYVAFAILAVVGLWMLVTDEEAEKRRLADLTTARGLALVALGISVSLDELAMGLSVGLLHLSVWLAVILIGAQAFLIAQLGMRLGARGGEALSERAERSAGLALIALAVLLLVEKLAS
jgi:putative Mn2+ efflux pump MntP